MPDAGGDQGRLGALGDEERDVALSEVVEPHRLTDGGGYGTEHCPAAKRVAEEGPLSGL